MTQSEAIEAGGQELSGVERDRIIRKIKRCLALGESSNRNESEMAIRQAQAMMRTYRLSEADVHASNVHSDTRDTGLKRVSEWQRYLATAAAEAFGCKLFSRRSYGLVGVKFIFVGVMPAAELAAYAYDALLAQLKAQRKEFMAKRASQSNHRGVGDDFCVAWVYAVHEKIRQFARDNPVQGTQHHALVLIKSRDDAAIDAWVAKEFKKVEKGRPRTKTERDREALMLGRQAGERATINQAVQGATDSQLALTMRAGKE